MEPWKTLDRARTPDGRELVLYRRGGEFVIRLDGWELMGSRAHGSEESLAELACSRIRNRPATRVLVGGLGLGFTLRAALDRLSVSATVVVAELVPAVIEWNLGPLGPLAGWPLRDGRVNAVVADVGPLLRGAEERSLDAILLDVDNGPEALTHRGNDGLYRRRGLGAAWRALKPGAVLAVWSASPSRTFVKRLRSAGFDVETAQAAPHPGARAVQHTIFLGRRLDDG